MPEEKTSMSDVLKVAAAGALVTTAMLFVMRSKKGKAAVNSVMHGMRFANTLNRTKKLFFK